MKKRKIADILFRFQILFYGTGKRLKGRDLLLFQGTENGYRLSDFFHIFPGGDHLLHEIPRLRRPTAVFDERIFPILIVMRPKIGQKMLHIQKDAVIECRGEKDDMRIARRLRKKNGSMGLGYIMDGDGISLFRKLLRKNSRGGRRVAVDGSVKQSDSPNFGLIS